MFVPEVIMLQVIGFVGNNQWHDYFIVHTTKQFALAVLKALHEVGEV